MCTHIVQGLDYASSAKLRHRLQSESTLVSPFPLGSIALDSRSTS